MKSLLFAAALIAAASPIHALARETAPSVTVEIRNFMFTPMTVTIPQGGTVVWTNRDDIPHTVVEKSKAWRSAALDTNESYSKTFDAPGTYDYYCGLHPKMVAKVIVTPAGKAGK
ncbi:MAG: cupredoxin domain-containing protein [Asticcacaulis sp.]